MRDIIERTILIREPVRLPDDLELVMEAFGEGWSCVNSGDSQWLDKQIRARGWYFIRSNEEVSGTGVGETTHEAIINALKLALRRVSDN